METQNLWPDFKIETIRSPKSILKEQAGYLMEKTNNILSADVTSSNSEQGKINHTFWVVAPALDNYRYSILTITHGAFYYPLVINLSGASPWENYYEIEATNQDGLIDGIRRIFNEPETVKVITSLLSQSLAD